MSVSEKRFGFVGIIVAAGCDAGSKIQNILSRHAGIILGRMGLPRLAGGEISVITLIIHADSDELGSLTGQLGRLEGVSVKSGMAKMPQLQPTGADTSPGTADCSGDDENPGPGAMEDS